MKVEMKLRGVDGVVDMLRSLPPEVVSKRGGPVKLSLAKGARFMRDKAKGNLRAAIAQRGDDSTGLLEKSVIASRGKPPSSGKGERYLVRVKRKAYDLAKISKKETFAQPKSRRRVTTLQTANLLEYGSAHQPATPWLRPAVTNHGEATINVVTSDLVPRVERLAASLAKAKGIR